VWYSATALSRFARNEISGHARELLHLLEQHSFQVLLEQFAVAEDLHLCGQACRDDFDQHKVGAEVDGDVARHLPLAPPTVRVLSEPVRVLDNCLQRVQPAVMPSPV
jgi:hypothetical protein